MNSSLKYDVLLEKKYRYRRWNGPMWWILCFIQAEDGIRDLVRSRGLGDVYKRQRGHARLLPDLHAAACRQTEAARVRAPAVRPLQRLSLIHI